MRQEAYEALRELIVAGTLAPDESLNDQAVAGWLGVSRMPVREALFRLADEGLVVIAANRFTRVAPLSGVTALEAHRILGWLDGEVTAERIAAPAATVGLEPLADTFRWALWRGEASEVIAADHAFHAAIRGADTSLSATLTERLEPLARRAQLACWPALAASWPEESHVRLLEAAARGDSESARAAVSSEWRMVGEAAARILPA